MNEQIKPVLSIGMIVKNEESKLGKCLKAMQPLREAIPCEIVIADTGSTDGTRAIAEQYADLVFDFPWVNDFSAARNAVMDKCTGLWYMTVDADEYLDEGISELVAFLTSKESAKYSIGYITIRNYDTVDMDGDYDDFMALRLVNMRLGIRYAGTIHESVQTPEGSNARVLPKTILHHDGYAWQGPEAAQAKMQRNLALLEAAVAKQPNNARILMQCIESSNFQPDKRKAYAHQAMNLIQNGKIEDPIFVPPLVRNVCIVAAEEKMPEAAEWIDWAQAHYSGSAFVKVDVSFAAALQAYHAQNHKKVIRAGEKYKSEWKKFSGDPVLQAKTLCLSPLHRIQKSDQQRIDLILSEAYVKTDTPEKALNVLRDWDLSTVTSETLANWVRAMTLLEHVGGAEEEALRVFESINSVDAEVCLQQRDTYVNTLIGLFWRGEEGVGVFRRLPGLLGICAAFLVEKNPLERMELLESVANWEEYKVPLAQAAIQAGFALPEGFYRQPFEKLQDAVNLYVLRDSQNAAHAIGFLKNNSLQGGEGQFAFLLICAVLQANRELESEQMQLLCECFFMVSDKYLKWLYNPAVLQEERIQMLPGMYRFAWYVLQEQKHLERQEWSACIDDLHQALKAAPAMKNMVDHLLRQVERGQEQNSITPEMKALAVQIRAVLAQYAPDDPAVQMLMASPAYQKVAPILEKLKDEEELL